MKRLTAIILILVIAPAFIVNASAQYRFAVPDGNNFWYVIADTRTDPDADLSGYAAAVSEKLASGISDAEKPRYALICRALGIEREFSSSVIADDGLGELQAVVWRLLAAEKGEADGLLPELESFRKADGGFAVSGEVSDIDLTAMALAAEAKHGTTDVRALELLSERQEADGGYISFGVENCESCAQVAVALTVLGIDPRSDERFVKNGVSVYEAFKSFATADGYSHTAGGRTNPLASAEGYFCEAALECFLRGESIFDFSYTVVPATTDAPETEASPIVFTVKPKPVILLCVALAAAVIFVLLALRKKANPKNLVTLGIVTLAALLVVTFTDVKTVEEYYSEHPDPITPGTPTVTLTVRDGDKFLINSDVLALRDGDTALTLLERSAKYEKIRVDASGGYVSGIGGLYEFDRGALSGWRVYVNGVFVTVSADDTVLSDGDLVEWVYSEEAWG